MVTESRRFDMRYLPILLVSFLWTATLFAQANPSVVYIEGNPSSATGGFNPYPGIGTVPSGGSTEIPTTTLYPEHSDEATFGLPSPTQRTSEIFFSNGQTPRRDGLFQKVNFNVLWAPKGSGDSAVGLTVLDLSAAFALPFPSKESPLMLTPLFQTWFFDSSSTNGTFYTTGLDIRWFAPIIKNKFTLDLGAAPLYSGDFKAKKESFRIPARLAGIWTCNPRTKFVLGVLYQDRSDSYNWMPMGGVIWTPNEDINFELTYPKLRISQRIKWWGSVAGDSVSDWLYGGFEFNGGSWGYRVESKEIDIRFDYRDYRLLFGYERRCLSGLTIAIELGWMFDRKISYNGYGSYHPDDAFFLQLKTAF